MREVMLRNVAISAHDRYADCGIHAALIAEAGRGPIRAVGRLVPGPRVAGVMPWLANVVKSAHLAGKQHRIQS